MLVVHLALVKRHGLSPRPEVPAGVSDPEDTIPFTGHIRHLAGLSLILLGVLIALAATTSTAVGAAPVEGIEVTKPLWPFYWLYQVENWVGLGGLFWAPLVVFILLAALPFLDRRPERRPSRRRWVVASALVLFGVWALLTVIVASSGVATHLG